MPSTGCLLEELAPVALLKFNVSNRHVDAGCLNFGGPLRIRPVLRGTVGREQRAARFSYEPKFTPIAVLGICLGIRSTSDQHLYEFRPGQLLERLSVLEYTPDPGSAWIYSRGADCR